MTKKKIGRKAKIAAMLYRLTLCLLSKSEKINAVIAMASDMIIGKCISLNKPEVCRPKLLMINKDRETRAI